MTKNPSDTIYWNDWAGDPNLKACSFAARGLWMEMLCIMARAKRQGELKINGGAPTIDELSRVVGGTPKEIKLLLEELFKNGVYSLTSHRVIYNRRMARSRHLSEQRAKAGSKGGIATRSKQRGNDGLPQQKDQQIPQQTESPSSSSLSSESSREDKRARKRETLIPKDCPNPEDRAKARAYWKEKGFGFDIDEQAELFRAWCEANDKKYKVWSAGWRTWYMNAVRFARENGKTSQASFASYDTKITPEIARQYWAAFKVGGWQAIWGDSPEQLGCKTEAEYVSQVAG